MVLAFNSDVMEVVEVEDLAGGLLSTFQNGVAAPDGDKTGFVKITQVFGSDVTGIVEPAEIRFAVKKPYDPGNPATTNLTRFAGYVKALDLDGKLIAPATGSFTYYEMDGGALMTRSSGPATIVVAGSGVVDPLYEGRYLGDVNNDLIFDLADVLVTKQAAAGKALDDVSAHLADFDYSGVIQGIDAFKAQQLLVKLYAFVMPKAPEQKPGTAKVRVVGMAMAALGLQRVPHRRQRTVLAGHSRQLRAVRLGDQQVRDRQRQARQRQDHHQDQDLPHPLGLLLFHVRSRKEQTELPWRRGPTRRRGVLGRF